jgi:hypothetical protein
LGRGECGGLVAERGELTDDLFKAALRQAPPWVMDARSWNYWHLVFEDGDLPTLSRDATTYLAGIAAGVGSIPDLVRASRSLAPKESISS